MDWKKELYNTEEKPLDCFVEGYSNTSMFRKIAFIGDSLSSGEFQINDEKKYYDMFEHSWGQYIARKNGITAYNFSRGGMTAEWYIGSFAEEKGFWDKELKCQAYVIALGVNDIYGKNMEIGSIDDIDPNDYRNNKPTFAGYYAQIVSRYKEICPDAKFFFVGLPNDCRPQGPEVPLKVLDLLNQLAEHFGDAYVIDLFHYAPVYDKEFKQHFFLGGHMNPSGYILTAKMIDSYIDYIIRHNPEDFNYVGFIGTDIKYK